MGNFSHRPLKDTTTLSVKANFILIGWFLKGCWGGGELKFENHNSQSNLIWKKKKEWGGQTSAAGYSRRFLLGEYQTRAFYMCTYTLFLTLHPVFFFFCSLNSSHEWVKMKFKCGHHMCTWLLNTKSVSLINWKYRNDVCRLCWSLAAESQYLLNEETVFTEWVIKLADYFEQTRKLRKDRHFLFLDPSFPLCSLTWPNRAQYF